MRGRRISMAMQTGQGKASLIIALLVILVFSGGMTLWSWSGNEAEAVREYTLEIIPKDIDYGNGAVWHAWTFNGKVPGTTLTVKAGEILKVKVINRHNMTHSFHAHLDNYSLQNDGSQANVITGVGTHTILPPGGENTWQFRPTTPGVYYYHTHWADPGITPTQAVTQGLYGAIIVQDPKEPPMREEVLFMGEIGHETEGKVVPYIMNGMGFPGGEVGLMHTFHEKGYAGLAEQFNRTLPVFKVKVNEPFKLHVVNIGSLEHSLYIHSATVTSLGVLEGRPWPARVLPLVQGTADTLLVNFSNPGLWLFHCHVDPHADAGMIGLFDVEA